MAETMAAGIYCAARPSGNKEHAMTQPNQNQQDPVQVAAEREQDPKAAPQDTVKVEKKESTNEQQEGKLSGPVVLANEKNGGEGDEDSASA